MIFVEEVVLGENIAMISLTLISNKASHLISFHINHGQNSTGKTYRKIQLEKHRRNTSNVISGITLCF